MLSIGVGNAFLLTAISRAMSDSGARILPRLILAKLVAYGVAVMTTSSFLPAICDQVLTALIGVSLIIRDRFCNRRLPAAWLLAGLGLAMGAGAAQVLKFRVSDALNHNVLYHLAGMLSLVAFCLAGVAYKGDRPITSPTTAP
jgi:hypothetical protein